jgi:hypothetical protein
MPPSTAKGEQVSQAVIEERRQRVREAIEKTRLLPPDWRNSEGKTRDEVIRVLEQHLETLDQGQQELARRGQKGGQSEASTNRGNEVVPLYARQLKEEEMRRFRQEGRYFTIRDTLIPVCEPPTGTGEWEAVPSEVFVSGGRKFAKVRFVSDRAGLTLVAKPGEPLPFENYRGHRLEWIDTVLEGPQEIRAFNTIRKRLAELMDEYRGLNPDAPDYDTKAKELSEKIVKFTSVEGLKEVVDLDNYQLEDVEDFAARAADILRIQQFLRSLDDYQREFIPSPDPNFKLVSFFEEKLAWFAQLVNRQLGLGNNAYLEELAKNNRAPEWEHLSAKGMTVIVGPRGAGKNELIKFYCAVTNRPLYRYPCSPDKEERDLTYDVELRDGDVVRIPTRILTAVTTPNAVLVLDEINLLRPEVAKFFNSLLDGDRAIFLNDQVIRAAPGTIFVALMNPAEYDGVEDLPETIDDRSNIMTLDYPPFREIDPETHRERFRADEAIILKGYIDPVAGMSDDNFQKAWDYVINSRGEQISLDPVQIKVIQDLKRIVAIAERSREVVKAYKTRSGELRMEREISLRGTIDAVRFYSENKLWEANLYKMPGYRPGWNAAQYAIAATYLPHTETYQRGPSDRHAMELILAEVIS